MENLLQALKNAKLITIFIAVMAIQLCYLSLYYFFVCDDLTPSLLVLEKREGKIFFFISWLIMYGQFILLIYWPFSPDKYRPTNIVWYFVACLIFFFVVFALLQPLVEHHFIFTGTYYMFFSQLAGVIIVAILVYLITYSYGLISRLPEKPKELWTGLPILCTFSSLSTVPNFDSLLQIVITNFALAHALIGSLILLELFKHGASKDLEPTKTLLLIWQMLSIMWLIILYTLIILAIFAPQEILYLKGEPFFIKSKVS